MANIVAKHQALMPGSDFPAGIELPSSKGGNVKLAANDKNLLIIFYRGQFCPFCKDTLSNVNSKVAELQQAGIEVLAVSADPVSKSAPFVEELGLTFPVACELKEAHMRQLGLYVSDPKDYQPQDYRFAEPAYFLVNPTGKIRYLCIASFPMGGRPDVDSLIMGVTWVEGEVQRNPAFQDVIWGSK